MIGGATRAESAPAGGIGSEAADPGKAFRASEGIPVVPAFDGFRAVAILGIVLLHLLVIYLAPVTGFADFLALGVLPNMIDVLFIVSGFVVFLPTVAAAGDFGPVRNFALRRVARLAPALWIAVAFSLLLLVAWPGSPSPPLPSWGEIGLHLGFVHHIAAFADSSIVSGFGINGPLWTLTVEASFYVVLPLIAGLYFRHPLAGLTLAAVITVGWKIGMQQIDDVVGIVGLDPSPEHLLQMRLVGQDLLPGLCFSFALGMTSAWAYVGLQAQSRKEWLGLWATRTRALSALALLPLFVLFSRETANTTAVAPSLAREDLVLSLLIPLALTTFMLATALMPRRRYELFSNPAVRRLGDISYGVYVIHFPLLLYFGAILTATGLSLAASPARFWVLGPIVIGGSLIYGYLSARFVEQPIRRWAHRFGRRSQLSTAQGEAPQDGAA